MMNLFENLCNMNETAVRQESIDEYFDKLVVMLYDEFHFDVDNNYYDVDNWPEEFKASFVIYYTLRDNDFENIENIIKNYLKDKFNDINVSIEEDNKYENEFIDEAYVVQIKAYNKEDVWDNYNEELKLNEK